MKHALQAFVPLALVSLFLWGCKHNPGPDEVTKKFLHAIQEANYTEAKKYATEDSKAMLDALSAFQKMLPESSQEKFRNEKIIIEDVKIKDSLAVVTYAGDIDTTRKTLKLKKENDNWKVAFTKETILPELTKPLNPADSTMQRQ
jgi:hypothetical protein